MTVHDGSGMMKTYQRFLLPCSWAALLLAGCATIRPTAEAPAPPPVAPTIGATEAPKTETPLKRVRRLLHQAFSAVESGNRSVAIDSLAIATDLLIERYTGTEATPNWPMSQADDFTRAAIDTYYDALPPETPISSRSHLARLIHVLPRALHSALSINDRYRTLYIRVLAGTSPIRIDLNEAVLAKIAFFQKNDQRIFRTWMRRMGTYGPLITQTLRQEDLPEDLIFLSMIESGFNTKAYSKARAVGMWQFVSHTGRLYGLRRDTWIDQRRDPEKATRAAARHLRHLYNLFGDWQLVITAYNCGQGRLQRSIRKDGSHNFWDLASLPRETRNHLPKFMAVLLMSRDPGFFGVHNLVIDDPLAFDTVEVTHPIDLRLGAQCAGTTYQTMRSLNPELRLGYSPPVPARKTYALRVPLGASDRFLDRYAKLPADKKVQLIDYKVQPGDTVSNIALTFGVRSSVVLDANGIRNPRRLRAGQKLKIPVQPTNSKHARRLAAATKPTLEAGQGDRVVYKVRRGDTLWDIAQSQGVSPDQIRAWNTLRATGHIHPGDKLTIWRAPTQKRSGSSVTLANARQYHRVRRGDTLWDIARLYKTSIRELKRLNGIRDASQIKAGDRLRLHESVSVE